MKTTFETRYFQSFHKSGELKLLKKGMIHIFRSNYTYLRNIAESASIAGSTQYRRIFF
jgi:hypothetical protein